MAKKPTYAQRRDNYYGHQSMNLRSREAILAAGAKPPKKPEDLPMMDAREDSAQAYMRSGDRVQKELQARLEARDRAKKRPK